MNGEDRVTEIAGRVAAATEGPWASLGYHILDGDVPQTHLGEVFSTPSDAEFIAHAREDIPYLLERLRTAEAELVTVKQQRSDNLQAIAERDALLASNHKAYLAAIGADHDE